MTKYAWKIFLRQPPPILDAIVGLRCIGCGFESDRYTTPHWQIGQILAHTCKTTT